MDSDGSSFHQQVIPISHLASKSLSLSNLSDLPLLSTSTCSAITEELFQEGSNTDLEISTGYLPLQNILKSILYLFQCFYEVQVTFGLIFHFFISGGVSGILSINSTQKHK